MDAFEYMVEMKKANLREVDLQEFERYKEFVSSVGCLIAEGSEFMTKEQLYVAIKNAFSRIIVFNGSEFKTDEQLYAEATSTFNAAPYYFNADGPLKEKDND